MFQYDEKSQTLRLDTTFEQELTQGKFCPSFSSEILEFNLRNEQDSSEWIQEYELKVVPRGLAEISFNFSYDWNIA